MCSSPQSGHCIRPATSGNRLNTAGSVSIAVETARPVRGQRIITAPIGPSPDSPEPKLLILAVGDTAKAVPRHSAPPVWTLWITFFDFLLEPRNQRPPAALGPRDCVIVERQPPLPPE